MSSACLAKRETLASAAAAARACRLCEDRLPLGPRPILRVSTTARLLIVAQAPGTKVHETGLSFNDRSGDRLREWLAMSRETFYDESRVAILPMGMCYPGRDSHGGDRPPIRDCAPLWHPRLRPLLPRIELTLLIGSHAQRFYLKDRAKPTLNETMRAFRDYLPEFLVLPHPSWRNTGWLRRNPWFAAELLPELRRRVKRLMYCSGSTR